MKSKHNTFFEKLANMVMLAAAFGWLVWAFVGGHGDPELIGHGTCIAAAAAGASFTAKMVWRCYTWRI